MVETILKEDLDGGTVRVAGVHSEERTSSVKVPV